jgi:uncharacterized protein YndB with AHSA1/START domain
MTLADLDPAGEEWMLTFTRTLPHPPDKVWRALTEPEHLAAWFPADIEGERAAGAKLRFVFRNNEGPPIDGEMLTYDPPELLEFTWGSDRYRIELRPEGDGTVLTFVNTFSELGKAARDAAGWDVCLETLALHLDGEKPDGDEEGHWKTAQARYAERFGPDATTIGPPPGRF